MTSDKVRQSIQTALAQLHEERERIDVAIDKLEACLTNLPTRGKRTTAERRDFKSKRADTRAEAAYNERSRAGWTQEAREAARNRMRKYWSERRKQSSGRNSRGKKSEKRSVASAKSSPSSTARRDTSGWTPEAREAARNRMREYWNQRKRQKASG